MAHSCSMKISQEMREFAAKQNSESYLASDGAGRGGRGGDGGNGGEVPRGWRSLHAGGGLVVSLDAEFDRATMGIEDYDYFKKT